jgi:hypothetical protein
MKLRAAVIGVGLALACVANAYAITPAYEYSGFDGIKTSTSAMTVGFEFTLSKDTTIDALGYFDDGKGKDHEVGIWNSAGSLLASTTVHGSDVLSGNYYYSAIGALTLSAGTYVIGGTYLGDRAAIPYALMDLTTASNFSWTRALQTGGTGLLQPTQAVSGYGDYGIAAVNFSVAAVPEPATYAMLLGGLGMLGAVARRRRA